MILKTGQITDLAEANVMQIITLGCIAVTNREIDELYNAVNIGTRIEIIP